VGTAVGARRAPLARPPPRSPGMKWTAPHTLTPRASSSGRNRHRTLPGHSPRRHKKAASPRTPAQGRPCPPRPAGRPPPRTQDRVAPAAAGRPGAQTPCSGTLATPARGNLGGPSVCVSGAASVHPLVYPEGHRLLSQSRRFAGLSQQVESRGARKKVPQFSGITRSRMTARGTRGTAETLVLSPDHQHNLGSTHSEWNSL